MPTEHVKLIASREGLYTVYVFKNLDSKEYIMCTKLPNWNSPTIFIGDEGFLTYQVVKAGESYYDPNLESDQKYRYSNVYFTDFIIDNKSVHKNEIIL